MANEARERARVRIASAADAGLLARFRYELRSAFDRAVENDEAFMERCTNWMQQRLGEGGEWQCWIAEWNQSPVGNVWAQVIEKIPNPVAEPECYIYLTNFYVREQYRSKGIGAMLLSEALAWS